MGKLLRLLQRAEYALLQGYEFADDDLSVRALANELRATLDEFGYERLMNHEAYARVEEIDG